jgi:hypothetical protein
MPKDNDFDLADINKPGQDLTPGDIIREKKGINNTSIIISINGEKDEPKNHFLFYDINMEDYLFGFFEYDQVFTIIRNRKEILKYYDLVELQLLRKSANLLDGRRELVKLRKDVIIDMNKKLDMNNND